MFLFCFDVHLDQMFGITILFTTMLQQLSIYSPNGRFFVYREPSPGVPLLSAVESIIHSEKNILCNKTGSF